MYTLLDEPVCSYYRSFYLYIGFFCGGCPEDEGVALNLQSCESDCAAGVAVFILWSESVICL